MLRDDGREKRPGTNPARRTLRLLFALLLALAASYWAGRVFGLGNDELLGYLLASVGLIVASGVVASLLFGVTRLFRR